MIHKSYKAIDNLGGIVIPKDFRRELDLVEKDNVMLELQEGRIIITKAEPSCVICGSTENLMPCKGKYLCRDCAKDISK